MKILGLFNVFYDCQATGVKWKSPTFIVMPNLFYNRQLTRVFDLKGSMRNRLAVVKPGAVLQDENYLNSTQLLPRVGFFSRQMQESMAHHVMVLVSMT